MRPSCCDVLRVARENASYLTFYFSSQQQQQKKNCHSCGCEVATKQTDVLWIMREYQHWPATRQVLTIFLFFFLLCDSAVRFSAVVFPLFSLTQVSVFQKKKPQIVFFMNSNKESTDLDYLERKLSEGASAETLLNFMMKRDLVIFTDTFVSQDTWPGELGSQDSSHASFEAQWPAVACQN